MFDWPKVGDFSGSLLQIVKCGAIGKHNQALTIVLRCHGVVMPPNN